METREKAEIRDAVRQRYGQIAKTETAKSRLRYAKNKLKAAIQS